MAIIMLAARKSRHKYRWWLLCFEIFNVRLVMTLFDPETEKTLFKTRFHTAISLMIVFEITIIISYPLVLEIRSICCRQLLLTAKLLIFFVGVFYCLRDQSMELDDALKELLKSIVVMVLMILVNLVLFFVVSIFQSIGLKQLLMMFIERSEVQAEKQAILETLEIGVIMVSDQGIMYFNREGEKTLIKCIMHLT